MAYVYCYFSSNGLQEYKQKHQERKAAVRKELGLKFPNEQEDSDSAKAADKSSKQVTEDGAGVVTANGHMIESAEQNQLNEKMHINKGESSDSRVKMMNGGPEVTAAGEEAYCGLANGGVDAFDKTESEKNDGKVNGTANPTASPPALKTQRSWADVVSKSGTVNQLPKKDAEVNGVTEEVTANGTAEE